MPPLDAGLREVEDSPAERGLDISYEIVRSCVAKFGPACAGDGEGEVLDLLVWVRRDEAAVLRLMR